MNALVPMKDCPYENAYICRIVVDLTVTESSFRPGKTSCFRKQFGVYVELFPDRHYAAVADGVETGSVDRQKCGTCPITAASYDMRTVDVKNEIVNSAD